MAAGWGCAGGAGGGVGARTTGGTNSITTGCSRRLRHHSPAKTAARRAAAPAIHGQYEPDDTSCAPGSITAVAGGALVRPELVGDGETGWKVGLGAVLEGATGCGAVAVRGSGAGARAGPELRGAGTFVIGALGVGVGLAAGTGVGVGLGRGAGVRIIGASLSTGPCARGLLVGRPLGIEKSGIDWASDIVGASKSPSAIAPVAAFALPPSFCINRSIF